MQNPPAYPVTAVDNALRTLTLLRTHGQLRVVDVAEHLQVAPSTAHRLLAMLRFHGFAVQDSRKLYRPGPQLRGLHRDASATAAILSAARSHLEELARRVEETVHLVVLEGNGVRFIAGVDGPKALRVGSRIGLLLPAHTTSGGKALLAELPTEELHALYPRGLPRSDTSAITDYTQLLRELDAVRRQGYALNIEESEPGVSAVGACIRDSAGMPIAALAIAAPASRSPRRRLMALAGQVVAAAERIRRTL
jgi:DNA-binding IclR family transcriptional regulator